jgi:hypothetical protein
MNNPFSTDALVPNWTKASEILKGDTPGHAFRGNQYTTASSLADKADGLYDKVQDSYSPYDAGRFQIGSFHNDVADQHRAIAAQHRAIIGSLKQAAQQATNEGKPILASHLISEMQAHADAAQAHEKAADEHNQVIDLLHNPRAGDWSQQEDVATEATRDANLASAKAAQAEADTNSLPLTEGSVGKSAEILKGDTPGHAFHGNQYAEGSLSDTSSRLARFVTKTRTNIPPATAHDIADSHMAHAEAHRDAAQQLRSHVEMITSPENLHMDGEATQAQVRATLARAAEYSKAADAHEAAAQAHEKAADTVLKSQGEWGGRLGLNEKAPTASQVSAASNAAAKASAAAENLVPYTDANVQLPLGAPYYGQ